MLKLMSIESTLLVDSKMYSSLHTLTRKHLHWHSTQEELHTLTAPLVDGTLRLRTHPARVMLQSIKIASYGDSNRETISLLHHLRQMTPTTSVRLMQEKQKIEYIVYVIQFLLTRQLQEILSMDSFLRQELTVSVS